MQTLEDFTLDLAADGRGGHTVRVLASPAGEGREGMGLAPEPAEIVRFFAGLERLRGAQPPAGRDLVPAPRHAARVRDRRTTARALGEGLYRALLPGQVGQLFRTSQALVAARGTGLRIRIRLDADQEDAASLHRVPWELLFDPVDERFLAWSREAPVVRYLELAQPVQAPPLPGRLSILVLMANPAGTVDLDLAAERQVIARVWRDHPAVTVRFLPDSAGQRGTFDALRRELLAAETHVLHFMGHGGFDRERGRGTLSFEHDDGRRDAVSGADLARLLGDFDSLRLVVLNACHTAEAVDADGANPFAGVATALVRGGVPAVVAMQAAISDRAAIAFCQELYHRLAQGEPVDLAVVEGRRGVGRPEKTDEWAIPVLFQRGANGQLFATPTEARDPLVRPDAWTWNPRGAFLLAAGVFGLALFGALGSLWLMPWPALRLSLAAGASVLTAITALLLHQDPVPGRRLSHGLARRRGLGFASAALPLAAAAVWTWAGGEALCRAECGRPCPPPGTLRVAVEPFAIHFPGGEEELGNEIAGRVSEGLAASSTVELVDAGPAAADAWRCVDLRLRGSLREEGEETVLEAELFGLGGAHRGGVEARAEHLTEDGRLRELQNRLVDRVLQAVDAGLGGTVPGDEGAAANAEAMELNRQGTLWFQEGDYYRAAAAFALALDLDPTYADAANNLGMARLRQGDFAAAASLFERAAHQLPDHATYHFNLGLALDRGGQPKAAATAYRQVIRLDRAHARALNNLGFVLIQVGDLDAAHDVLDRGLGFAADPQVSASLRKNLGLLALERGRSEQALEHLDWALEHVPAFPEALFLRAQALEQGAAPGPRACAAWRAYAALAPRDENDERRRIGLAQATSPACQTAS